MDETSAHIKSALTATTLPIPLKNSYLMLGTRHGIFCWNGKSISSVTESGA
ncbi:YjbQ family protein [Amphritea atlantica]|uniref:YjbQ family protein n=1 Tax=Amphritea atlantica TaxID=355243 RepID=A0ABY5H066_9GAMM|nr:YjbQ family protein [Amphritea atlantica]